MLFEEKELERILLTENTNLSLEDNSDFFQTINKANYFGGKYNDFPKLKIPCKKENEQQHRSEFEDKFFIKLLINYYYEKLRNFAIKNEIPVNKLMYQLRVFSENSKNQEMVSELNVGEMLYLAKILGSVYKEPFSIEYSEHKKDSFEGHARSYESEQEFIEGYKPPSRVKNRLCYNEEILLITTGNERKKDNLIIKKDNNSFELSTEQNIQTIYKHIKSIPEAIREIEEEIKQLIRYIESFSANFDSEKKRLTTKMDIVIASSLYIANERKEKLIKAINEFYKMQQDMLITLDLLYQMKFGRELINSELENETVKKR